MSTTITEDFDVWDNGNTTPQVEIGAGGDFDTWVSSANLVPTVSTSSSTGSIITTSGRRRAYID